jgi:hypothetical protein
MTAASLDLYIEQGATYRSTIVYAQANADGTAGTPYDLTGCTARMMIRSKQADTGTPVVSLTTENGGLTLGGTDGTIAIYIEPMATESVSIAAKGVYDLEIVFPSGDVSRVVEGKVTFDPAVTRVFGT